MASIDSFNDLPDDVLLAMVQDPLFDENDPTWQQSAEDYMADAITLDSANITKGAPNMMSPLSSNKVNSCVSGSV